MTDGAPLHVLVVGAGFSGTALAMALLDRGARVTLVERDAALVGRGVAYGRAEPPHLLNVRAGGMSAFADRPQHFVEWLEREGRGDADSFAARTDFGRYLREQLAAAEVRAGGRLAIVRGALVHIAHEADAVSATLADGTSLYADHAVLATGNLPPLLPGAKLPSPHWVEDPWTRNWRQGLARDAAVMLVGSGLTAIDVALSLDEDGHRGPIFALSRRGLRPQVHAAPGPRPPAPDGFPPSPARAVRPLRARAAAIGWRGAVDALRPVTQQLWQEAGHAGRARFLRHLRPWWDIHRHRIAPEIGARIDAMIGNDRLRFAAGRIEGMTLEAGRAQVDWRPRGGDEKARFTADSVVNCTGPQTDVLRSDDPLLVSLVKQGTVRSGQLRIGFEVDEALRVVDASGRPSERLHAIGPITRDRFWEVVAVPDIREQVVRLADRIVQADVPQ